MVRFSASKSTASMATKFLEITLTDSVRRAQEHYFGRARPVVAAPDRDGLTNDEISFIALRDSFYLSTISETGWPYVQHRGGPAGFLRVLGPSQLAFADYKGNRQMISTGNLAMNDRVAFFLMDYPNRTRLKILGHARVEDARDQPELVTSIAQAEMRGIVERIVLVEVVSFDWNCPQYITPRFTGEEVRKIIDPLKARISELESQPAANDLP